MTVTGSENYTVSYTYDLNNRLLTETRTGSSPFTATLAYDRNGNQLSRSSGGQTEIRVYNAFNQLTEYNNGNTMSAYAYRADGLRHSVSVNGVRTYHVWALGHIMSEHDSDNRVVGRYTRGVGGRLIRCHVRHWWYLFDARGSVVQRVDFSGNVLHSYRYNAFGVEISPDPGNGNRFRFNGEYHDLHRGGEIYLRARIYNPRTGRFLSPDPHWNITNMQRGTSPVTLNGRPIPNPWAIMQAGNLFMFCGHNPVNRIDPTGLEWGYIGDFVRDLELIFGNSTWTQTDRGSVIIEVGGGHFSRTGEFFFDGRIALHGSAALSNPSAGFLLVGENINGRLHMHRTDFYRAMGIPFERIQQTTNISGNASLIASIPAGLLMGYLTKGTHWLLGFATGGLTERGVNSLLGGFFLESGNYVVNITTIRIYNPAFMTYHTLITREYLLRRIDAMGNEVLTQPNTGSNIQSLFIW